MRRELATSELESFLSLDWSDLAPRLTTPTRSSQEKVLETQNGACLSLQDCYTLANCGGDDLLGLLVAANLLRTELVGNIVSYVVNRNINFTNICFVGCKFCAFSRGPRESDAYFHTLDDMARKAQEAWELGATEVCIQGGLPHGLPPFYYRDILRAVKAAVPDMHTHAFSPMEVDYDEPRRVAEAVSRMKLKHVVVTAVARDDLKDGGANHFARVIAAIRERTPAARASSANCPP